MRLFEVICLYMARPRAERRLAWAVGAGRGAAPKDTAGTSRSAGSSSSKNGRLETFAMPAKKRDGNVLDLDVEVAHGHVVEAPRGLDLVLGVGELVLELEEVLVGLQIRVGLRDGEQLAQRAGERALGPRLRPPVPGRRRPRCGPR